MSVRAPERSEDTHRSGRRRGRAGLRDAPQPGFTSPEPMLKTRVKRHEGRRRRFVLRAVLAYLIVFGTAATGLWVLRPRDVARPVRPGPAPVSSLVAWSVHVDERNFTAVIALPPGRPAIAIAVPGETEVDLPSGGPATVGAATDPPGSLVAALQATFDQRISHYVVSDSADLRNLIDRAGGIRVLVGEPFTWEGHGFGPGDAVLAGGAAIEYLRSAAGDVTARWEDVLSALLMTTTDQNLAAGPIGLTDDPALVRSLLALAKGAPVVELPTIPVDGGGLQVDVRGLERLRLSRFPGIGGRLVRVVVLNGNGQPGIGAQVSSLLAPAGYRVVTSQNLTAFDTEQTRIIASTTDLLANADEVRGLLGIGMVYVGPQSTGIADITIVVGKDYSQA
jgi:hypothetical protein